jgi:hypothetical protein
MFTRNELNQIASITHLERICRQAAEKGLYAVVLQCNNVNSFKDMILHAHQAGLTVSKPRRSELGGDIFDNVIVSWENLK